MRRKASENGYGKEIKGRGLERGQRAEDRRRRKEGKGMSETHANAAPVPCTTKKTEGLT